MVLNNANIFIEKKKWKLIIEREIECLRFLIIQNIPLRGHNEDIINEDINNGNFFELITFVSTFDIVLNDHIEKIKNSKRILTSYLLPQIKNELIGLLSENVRNTILKKIKKSKYYGILYDSTPDVSHREQLSQIIRYVEKDNETKTIEVKERFINFIEIHGKKSEDITNSILKSLEDNGLDIQNCR